MIRICFVKRTQRSLFFSFFSSFLISNTYLDAADQCYLGARRWCDNEKITFITEAAADKVACEARCLVDESCQLMTDEIIRLVPEK